MFKKIWLALCLITCACGAMVYGDSAVAQTPNVSASGQPLKVYPPGAYVGSPASSPGMSSGAYGGGAGYAAGQSYAAAGQNGFYSGPDSTVGPHNPYSNLKGNMAWVSFAQRTPSFVQGEGAGNLGRPVYSGPVYSSSAPKKKAKKVAVAKKKSRTVKIPPKGTKEFDDFCQEMLEMCKDYLPQK